jgi:choline dehydrogenase-like flavoprotein
MTLAIELIKNGASVCVVERGRRDAFVLANDSPFQCPTLIRVHGIGGNTNVWGNVCKELRSFEIARRNWISTAHWPIPFKALQHYYPQAYLHCGIPLSEVVPPLENKSALEGFISTEWYLKPPARVPNCCFSIDKLAVIANSTCVEIELVQRRARGALIVGKYGAFTVKAGKYVICAGAVESTALIEKSFCKPDDFFAARLLGRYLCDHYRFAATLPIEAHRDEVEFVFRHEHLRDGLIRRRGVELSHSSQNLHHLAGIAIYLGDTAVNEGGKNGKFIFDVEQVPRHFNHLQYGAIQTAIECKLGNVELSSLQYSAATLLRFLGINDAIDQICHHLEECLPTLSPISHPSGTTRMSHNATNGVVSPSLNVHGTENLYVCSSSVFPTAGVANPTLTIVALACRLANHLLEK